ncbi:5-formyltetrahydrofolate cyclo-ligase [Pleurotus pulmonarius]
MITSALKNQKRSLRKTVASLLAALTPHDIQSQSRAIAKNVESLLPFRQCRAVSCYLSMPSGEVDTSFLVSSILASGKSLFVPKIDKLTAGRMDILRVYDSDDLNSLPPGTWGIREPDVSRNGELRQSVLDDDCDDLDIILVPGVAFDHALSRLGHGKGYYDRFISSYIASGRKRPVLVALALREQILTSEIVPMGEHDWTMDYIVGPDGVISRGDV